MRTSFLLHNLSYPTKKKQLFLSDFAIVEWLEDVYLFIFHFQFVVVGREKVVFDLKRLVFFFFLL